MNMELRAPLRAQKSKVEIVDCDFHPKITLEQIKPHLSERWWQYLQTYGVRQRHAYAKGYPFPKATPQAARRDAWPPGGGLPASGARPGCTSPTGGCSIDDQDVLSVMFRIQRNFLP